MILSKRELWRYKCVFSPGFKLFDPVAKWCSITCSLWRYDSGCRVNSRTCRTPGCSCGTGTLPEPRDPLHRDHLGKSRKFKHFNEMMSMRRKAGAIGGAANTRLADNQWQSDLKGKCCVSEGQQMMGWQPKRYLGQDALQIWCDVRWP